MLGQVLSFPSRQWLSALPPGVPSHPPAPGPARSPTLNILLFFVGLSTPVSENDLPKGASNEADVHQSGTLGACRPGHLPLFCFKVVGSGRGTEKLERPSPNLT